MLEPIKVGKGRSVDITRRRCVVTASNGEEALAMVASAHPDHTDDLDSAESVIISLALVIEARDAYTDGTARPYKAAATADEGYAKLLLEVKRGWRRRDLVDTFITLKIDPPHAGGIRP